jgi:hypothetical protein
MAAWRSNEPEYPIPPGHGEPDYTPARYGRGSNVRTDDAWAGVLDAPAYVPPEKELEWAGS